MGIKRVIVLPLQLSVAEKTQNVRRLEAQRNELNAKGKRVIIVSQNRTGVIHLLITLT